MRTFTFRTLFNNYGWDIEKYLDLDEHQLELDYEHYQTQQPAASERDYMWSLFNRIILKDGDSSIYRAMGRFVSTYEGKNGNRYHRLALKDEFEGIKRQYSSQQNGVKYGFYVIGDKRCQHSMTYDGNHDFEDSPDGKPLATDKCSLLSCTCCIGAIPLRDKNGDLVWLDKD